MEEVSDAVTVGHNDVSPLGTSGGGGNVNYGKQEACSSAPDCSIPDDRDHKYIGSKLRKLGMTTKLTKS